MPYLSWSEKTITDFNDDNTNSLYNQGFLFTRKGRGHMYRTRSLRVGLSKFELSSENRRVLKKTEGLSLKTIPLPHPLYDWHIHKMGYDFYKKKFGEKTFNANKLKELMTDKEKSNFNLLLEYTLSLRGATQRSDEAIPLNQVGTTIQGDPSVGRSGGLPRDDNTCGYCICFETPGLLHYCYPFYSISDTNLPISNIGMGMMLRAIMWAKEQGKKYVYLGSAQRPNDTYKLQFGGVEWWDGTGWISNVEQLKLILQKK